MLKDKMNEIDEAVEEQIMKQVDKYNRTHKKTKIDKSTVEVDPIMEFHESIPDNLLESLDPSNQNLIIFDDMVLSDRRSQDIMSNIFVKGRHHNCSVITLVQSFYRVPRVLRLQANWFVLFHSVSHAEIAKLHRECGSNVPRKLFIERILEVTKPRYSFVSIDLDDEQPYRKMNFIDPLFPEI